MTAPRQYLRGTTYLLTRRTFHGHFFLKPSKELNELFRYVLAVAAERYGIKLHAYCVLSNHYHLVVTDPDACLPDFVRDLNSIVARALNASIPRWEDFWSAEGHSAVALVTQADVVEKAAYTLANPVAACLVRSGALWPGLWSGPDSVGAPPVEVKRPRYFFDPEGPLPEVATLVVSKPPGFASPERFRTELSAALASHEAAAVRRATKFLGILKVLAQRPTDRPRAREVRRGLSPRIACRDRWKRVETLCRLRQFLLDYRQALEAWRADRPVLFPRGTYLMRVHHGAPCVGTG